MTAPQKSALTTVIAIAGMIATVFFSAGFARHELDGKEDASAHVLDMAKLRAEIAQRQTHDSADRADMRRIIIDIACRQVPSRRYCQERQP